MTKSLEQNSKAKKTVLAFVGMPGAGKSEAVKYLEKKGISFVRFGELTDDGVKALGLELTPENERNFREKIRKELGMEAYAIKAKPKIEELLRNNNVIAIDGLYSWEEYVFLKKEFPNLLLIHIYAEPVKRYKRLSSRRVRPVPLEKAYLRDFTEIDKLNKGGPIAIADHLIVNNSDNINFLYQKIEELLLRLKIIDKNS